MQNIIEYARQRSIQQLFTINSFSSSWNEWRRAINNLLSNNPTANQIYNLGDSLRDIFRTTRQSGRSQNSIVSGGASWEALICWYLNLCLINRRTFVIKHHNDLIPSCIKDAITVNYGNFQSNTESDLIALTYPDKEEYHCDKPAININNAQGEPILITDSREYPFLKVINALSARDFKDLEIHIIQCKTNWNDNAQIPMLWDAVYSATNFRNNITVGTNGYSIRDCARFSYSFITVPSNTLRKNNRDTYTATSTAVLRVHNLSGGNYWGLQSKSGVASSVKELLERNLRNGHSDGILNTINTAIEELHTTFSYFRL